MKKIIRSAVLVLAALGAVASANAMLVPECQSGACWAPAAPSDSAL